MDILKQLNTELGIDGHLSFSAGNNGLARAVLQNKHGSAEVYLLGAHVTDWRNPEQEPLLFLSSKAEFGVGKAIRGGIPIVFPQFGLGPLPAHGFARNREWDAVSSMLGADDEVELDLRLLPSAEIRSIWPHEFELRYRITLGESLEAALEIKNCGKETWHFNVALHTYFMVGDILQTSVLGLSGLTYLDSLKERTATLEKGKELLFPEQVDRIYTQAPDTLTIVDGANGRKFKVEKSNLPDAVAWNPGPERAKAIADLQDEDYRAFVCLEPASAAKAISLPAGGSVEVGQKVSLL